LEPTSTTGPYARGGSPTTKLSERSETAGSASFTAAFAIALLIQSKWPGQFQSPPPLDIWSRGMSPHLVARSARSAGRGGIKAVPQQPSYPGPMGEDLKSDSPSPAPAGEGLGAGREKSLGIPPNS